MPSCCVFTCRKKSGMSSLQKDNITFHLFPREASTRVAWIKACGNHVTWSPKRTSTICSEHFETSCFKMLAKNKRRMIDGAVPTLKLPQFVNSKPKNGDQESVSSFKIDNINTLQDNNLSDTNSDTEQYIIVKVESDSSEGSCCDSINLINNHQIQDYNRQIEESNRLRQTEELAKNRQTEELARIRQIEESARNDKLKRILQMKNSQIKRLHSKNRYLKKKVEELQALLKTLNRKVNINDEKEN